jgi:thiamine-phosphate pyrophosphorylase
LQQARRQFTVPICAIGGVTPDNGSPLIAAGADLIAAVEGLFGDPDPATVERRARAYSQLFFPPS